MSALQPSGHAHAVYKGLGVDVDVCDEQTRHIVIVIHGDSQGAQERVVEYVTDDPTVAAALDTGVGLACAVIDGHECDVLTQHGASAPASLPRELARRECRIQAQLRAAPGGF